MARLQFRHLDNVFENREDAISYISDLTDTGKIVSTQFGESLIGEPLVVKYKDGNENHVILAIGKEGNKDENKHVEYHIIDSAYLEKGISDLSGITEDIKQQIDDIINDIVELDDRMDQAEEDIGEIKEMIEDLSGSTINEIKINVDDKWFPGSGSGTTAEIANGIANITLTSDNVRISDGYEGQLIHHNHSLTDFIAAVEGIQFEKVETGLETNVKEAYKLVDGDGHQMGDEIIKIYKDSSLYKVYLGHEDDRLEDYTSPAVISGTGETALCFIYQKADGLYELVAVNVESFLEESEFKDGLEVNNHIVKVKIDDASEPFLTVSSSGVKLSGVQDAIDNVSGDLEAFSAATVAELNAIKDDIATEIERAQASENELAIAIDGEAQAREDADNAILEALSAETSRATTKEGELQEDIDALDDRLTNITGQEGNTYKKHNTTPDDNANYINVAESMDNADFILDQKLGELSASTSSEIERLDNKIDSVNNTLTPQIQEISEALANEIERSTDKDDELDSRINTLENKTIRGDKAIYVDDAGDEYVVSLILNEEEKVLSQNAGGLKTTVTIDILKENEKDYILLKGINGQEISRVDATSFIKDGMLDSVEWIGDSNILQFTFNTDAGKEVINIDFAQFVNDELNRQIVALSGAVATINGDVTTPNSTYYKIDDVLIKYNVAGSAIDAAHTLIRYYEDAEGHKYYVSSNAKDMYYSGECLETVITNILSDMETVKEQTEEVVETVAELRQDVNDLSLELQREIVRATSAETAIHNEVTTEKSERQHEDALLWSAITTYSGSIHDLSEELQREITRATSAETAIQNNLNAEITRATERENEIENQLLKDVEYVASAKTINFYDKEGNLIDSIDATDFIKDGMVDNVEIVDNKLVITFNTDAGKETIEIPLTDIFNPDNYYTKDEVDELVDNLQSAVTVEKQEREDEDKEIWSAITELETVIVEEITSAITALQEDIEENYYTKQETNEIVEGLFAGAEYVSSAKTIEFYNNNGEVIDSIDATAFIKDGMVDNVEIVDNKLVITFNTDAGKETIEIPLTDIFNPEDYYTKDEVDEFVDNLQSAITVEKQEREDEDELIWSAISVEKSERESEDAAIWSAMTELDERVTENASAITVINENLGNYYTKDEIDDTVEDLFASVEYVSSAKTIQFYNNNGELLDSIDATDFIKDGMVDNVFVSGSSLYIVFNTDAGKETIEIPLTDIFNPEDYYTKDEVDTFITNVESAITIEKSEREAEDAAIWSAMTEGTGSLTDLKEKLEREIARATSAETIIQNNLDNEIEIVNEIERVTAEALNDLNRRVGETEEDITEINENFDNYYTKSEVDGIADGLISGVEYVSSAKTIQFFNNDGQVLDSIDATDFIKDGMVDNVFVSGSSLYITFNTDAGKETIEIQLSDIFNPEDYYTKDEVDTFITNVESAITIEKDERETEDELIWSAISETNKVISDAEFVISAALNDLNDRIVDLSGVVETKQDELVSGVNIKTINNQNLLGEGNIDIQTGGNYTAGTNIDITNNVISVTGISVPTSNTAFTNDANYITSAYTTQNYYDKQTIDNMFTQISGVFMKVTSAEYEAMYNAGTLDPDVLYVIID